MVLLPPCKLAYSTGCLPWQALLLPALFCLKPHLRRFCCSLRDTPVVYRSTYIWHLHLLAWSISSTCWASNVWVCFNSQLIWIPESNKALKILRKGTNDWFDPAQKLMQVGRLRMARCWIDQGLGLISVKRDCFLLWSKLGSTKHLTVSLLISNKQLNMNTSFKGNIWYKHIYHICHMR